MQTTMAHGSLSLTSLFERGRDLFGDALVWDAVGTEVRTATFHEVAEEASRFAGALLGLGVGTGDRVATMCWNEREHLVAYLAVPAIGAVLHTVNVRLSPDEIVYVLNQGGAEVLVVDGRLAATISEIRPRLTHVRTLVLLGASEGDPPEGAIAWSDVVASSPPREAWTRVDENSAAVICFTSGTTGLPKGVVYSHRSIVLHTLGISGGNAYGFSARDRVLTVVPMFHANAWGLPHAAWFGGSGLVLPGKDLSGPALGALVRATRPTVSAGVPTVWDDLISTGGLTREDVSSLRLLVSGGSAAPARLMTRYRDELGVRMVQGWGLTETSPLAAIGAPVAEDDPAVDEVRMASAGRVVAGVELRVVGDDDLPVESGTGHIELRGPWVTERYLGDDAPEKFHDGWLRTGDIGSVDEHGFVFISDRAKDLIKSGGEWIVSSTLEEALRTDDIVREVAVVPIPDPRWQERPAAWLVIDDDTVEDIDQALAGALAARVPKWWLPDRWIITNALPRTSVGKIDKRRLRDLASELIDTMPDKVLRYDF